MQPRPGMFDVERTALAAHRAQALREEIKCPTSNRLVARVVLSELKKQTEQRQSNCLWGVGERVHRVFTSGDDVQRVEDSRRPVGTTFSNFCSIIFPKQKVNSSRFCERIFAHTITYIILNATESWRKGSAKQEHSRPLCGVLTRLLGVTP